jgi:GNAT superfamily N-acetyltransferase
LPGRFHVRFWARVKHDAGVNIVPASPQLWPQIAELFAAGGDPKWCWCQFWRKPGSNWSNTSADENRTDLEGLVEGDPSPGLVALRDGGAVGWVGLGPRDAFPRLARSRTLPQLPGDRIWAVNCFVVARTARRSGIASALLAAAVEYARDHGAGLVEGYPVNTGGTRISSASVYTGTLGMFERAGFERVADSTSKASAGTPRVVVRRAL